MENRYQELLDHLEQDTLIVAGDVRSLRMHYSTLSDQLELAEERLAKMLQHVLELKDAATCPGTEGTSRGTVKSDQGKGAIDELDDTL